MVFPNRSKRRISKMSSKTLTNAVNPSVNPSVNPFVNPSNGILPLWTSIVPSTNCSPPFQSPNSIANLWHKRKMNIQRYSNLDFKIIIVSSLINICQSKVIRKWFMHVSGTYSNLHFPGYSTHTHVTVPAKFNWWTVDHYWKLKHFISVWTRQEHYH